MHYGGTYTHKVIHFTPTLILNALGVSPTDPSYFLLLNEARLIIEGLVLEAAYSLNRELTEELSRAMAMCGEFDEFPGYYQAMQNSMASCDIGVIYQPGGAIGAKFVDFDTLGYLPDLIEIANAAYPGRGTKPEKWAVLWKRMVAGHFPKLRETIETRISMMLHSNQAPFLQLVEEGNDQYQWAFPTFGPTNVFSTFEGAVYRPRMRRLYTQALTAVRSMLGRSFDYEPVVDLETGEEVASRQWMSRKGRKVAAVSGTEKEILVKGKSRRFGYGYIMRGGKMQRWAGFLPNR